MWIFNFVENRIQQDHGKSFIDFIYSSPDEFRKKFIKCGAMALPSKFDFSRLFVVIKTGKLLKPGQLKSVGHQNNTTGDQIDRIREIRNTFMHTAEPNLDESDYDDHINEFKDIGQRLEVINGEENGTYTMEIEEIHDKPFDTREVEDMVTLHKRYVEMV